MTQHIAWMQRIGLVAVLLAIFAVGPVWAHQGQAHAPAAQQERTAPPEAATADGEVVMTMPWPTEASDGGMMMMDHGARPTTFTGRLLRWLGALHPAAVHFPIALFLTAAFLEVMAFVRRKPIYTASNKLLLALATLGAFVAAPIGWVNAGLPAPDDETPLTLHRWLGTALPFLMLIVWRLKPNAEAAAAGRTGPLYAIALSVVAAAILAQADLGAEVTHGAGHMAF